MIREILGIEVMDYSFPVESGEVECVLLTSKGFNQLLEKIEAIGGGSREDKAVAEKEFLIQNATSAAYIASRYNKTNANKNGFSTIQIAALFEVSVFKSNGTSYESEKVISERIFEAITKIRG